MGILLSCCKEREPEEEPLIASNQRGYGGEGAGNFEEYSDLQRLKQEEENKLMAREQQLRDIVSDTNDKLIDISMISNSGIVTHGRDVSTANNDTSEGNISEQEAQRSSQIDAKSTAAVYTPLDANSASRYTVTQLRSAHSVLFDQLQSELEVRPTGDLVVNL